MGPLDWTVQARPAYPSVDEPEVSISDEDVEDEDDEDNGSLDDSYFGWDLDQWDDHQGERNKDLPEGQITQFKSILPITEILDN